MPPSAGRRARFRRIVLVTDEWPDLALGGVATEVFDHALTYRHLGFEVTVLCTYASATLHRLVRPPGIRLLAVPLEDVARRCQVLARLVGRRRDTMVHVHNDVSALPELELLDERGTPHVVFVHGLLDGFVDAVTAARTLNRRVEVLPWLLADGKRQRRMLRRAPASTVFVSQSDVERTRIRSLYGARRPLLSLTPGFNPRRFRLRPGHRWDGRARPPGVAFVGRMVPEKGIQDFLEACDTLARREPAPRFFVAGEPDGATWTLWLWRQLAARRHVRWLGRLDQRSVPRFLRDHVDVLMVPSLYEPFGLVALEGVASGCQVVVSPRVGARSVVGDTVGVVTMPGLGGAALVDAFDRLPPPRPPDRAELQAWRRRNTWRRRLSGFVSEMERLFR